MEDPNKALTDAMQHAGEIAALQAKIKNGQRLLSAALRQRDTARYELDRSRSDAKNKESLLQSLEASFVFKFHSRWLKAAVRRVLP